MPPRPRRTFATATGAALGAALLLGCASSSIVDSPFTDGEGLIEVRSLVIEGEARRYIVHAPEGVDPQGAGVAIVFHGAGGSGQGMLVGTDLERVSRDRNFVMVYPDANHANWAEGCDCTAADRVHGTADTTLVSAIIDDVVGRLGADAERVWAIGFSQGGMFAQRLACQMSERFQGVAVVAASMSVQLGASCDPTRPVDLLMMLSTVDPVFSWEGQPEGNFGTLGAVEMFEAWTERNGCAGGALDPEAGSGGARRYSGTDCPAGARVELIGVEGGAHSWYMSSAVDTSGELVRFTAG